MAIDEEVGARLVLRDRQQFAANAKSAAKDIESIGTATKTVGDESVRSTKRFGLFTGKVKSTGATAVKTMGVAGTQAGTSFADGFTKDAQGHLHDANGHFVKAGAVAGSATREGMLKTIAMDEGSILNRVGRGFAAAGTGAGKRFGSSAHETAMEYIKTIGASAIGFFAAEKVKETLTESINLANSASKAQQTQAQALRSTHDASGMTAEGLNSLDEGLSKISAQSPIATKGLTNMLLTFPKITAHSGVFNQAAKQAQNLAIRMGTSLPGAARIMGRALNDPVKGLTALSRIGIRFSKGQTAVIKNLVATGQTAAAQQIVLDKVRKRVGGSAAAAVTPTDRLRLAWENFQEMLGKKLLPDVNKFSSWMEKHGIPDAKHFVDWLQRNWKTLTHIAVALMGLVGAWKIYRGVMAAAAAVTAIMEGDVAALNVAMDANPVGAIVIGVIALGAALLYAYKHSETFRDIVKGAFHVVAVAFDYVRDHWKMFATIFAGLMLGPIGAAIVFAVTHFTGLKNTALNIFHWIINAGKSLGNWFSTAWSAIWSTITWPFRKAWGLIKTIWRGLKAEWHALPGQIRSAFTGLVNIITAPWRIAFNLIARMWNDTVGKVSFHLPSWVPWLHGKGYSFPQMPYWNAMGGGGSATPGILARATGGPVTAGMPYVVGELGAELFIPKVSGTIVPNNRIGDQTQVGQRSLVSPAVAGQHARVESDLNMTAGFGDGQPVVFQVVLDHKVVAEAVYKDIRKKDARG